MIYRGARILTVLAIAGHHRTWLQRTTGLGVNTIGRLLEDTQQTPAAGTLQAAAASMGVTPEWLDPEDARRRLTGTEAAELRRCIELLRAIAVGSRIDARALPNVRPETALPHSPPVS